MGAHEVSRDGRPGRRPCMRAKNAVRIMPSFRGGAKGGRPVEAGGSAGAGTEV